MKTMAQVLKRQGALVRKIAAGAATDDERAEALKLQEALDAAAAAAAPDPTATMTLAEFQKLAEAELAELEKAPDDERLQRLYRNLKSIRAQGKSAPDDIVTVEVAPAPAILDDLEAKAAAFDQRTRTGVRDDAPAAPVAPAKDDDKADAQKAEPAEPFDKGTISQQLAVEALETLISKLAALRVLLTAGTADSKAFESAFDGWWTLQDAIRTFASIGSGGGAPAPAPAAPAEMSAEAPAPAETAKADWDRLSPRSDVESLYRELRRGASRVRGHERATQ